MTLLCLLGISFVAYKVIEEEYVLLKAGSAIDIRQWRSFRMAKLATRNFAIVVSGAMLFIEKMPVQDIFLSLAFCYLVIEFGGGILYRIKTRLASQNSSK